MTTLKTSKTGVDVNGFLETVPESQQDDCRRLITLMESVTQSPPVMWGPSMIGFGQYHYVYESGHEGDWFLAGFAPRKQNLSIYIMAGFDRYDALMSRLGKYKTGKACLYVRTLGDVDTDVLRELVAESVQYMKRKYG